MTHKEFKELKLFISTASAEELNEIARMMNIRRSHLQEIAGANLRVGDTVTFDAKTRGIVTGKVTKINKKTVKVKATNGVLWTVTPSLLEQVV
jgi:preprotein translocase subunit YajC